MKRVTIRSAAPVVLLAASTALGCTNTTLSVPQGHVASPTSDAAPLPIPPSTLDRDFDPLEASPQPAGGHMHHHDHGAMKMQKDAADPPVEKPESGQHQHGGDEPPPKEEQP